MGELDMLTPSFVPVWSRMVNGTKGSAWANSRNWSSIPFPGSNPPATFRRLVFAVARLSCRLETSFADHAL